MKAHEASKGKIGFLEGMALCRINGNRRGGAGR
jgi:hypothetical protein